jgi:hypothetical protein
MKKSFIEKVTLSALLLLLMSCQGQREIIKETRIEYVEPTFTGTVQQGGGGNGIGGKPIESYYVNLKETEDFKVHIAPLVSELAEIGLERIAADFLHIASNRDWFFVPAKLDQISKNVIGTFAVNEDTDQLALQDLRKIWVSDLFFKKMDPQDKKLLLIHELVMGMRLMQYKQKLDHCIAKSMTMVFQKDFSVSQLEAAKSECRKTYPTIDGFEKETFNLSRLDYDNVRSLTLYLNEFPLNGQKILSFLKESGLRVYDN